MTGGRDVDGGWCTACGHHRAIDGGLCPVCAPTPAPRKPPPPPRVLTAAVAASEWSAQYAAAWRRVTERNLPRRDV